MDITLYLCRLMTNLFALMQLNCIFKAAAAVFNMELPQADLLMQQAVTL